MPHYDYICETCGHEFEMFQSMMDQPIEECPECGKRVKRIITGGTGVIFRGSGFYHTDNKKASAAEKKPGKSNDTPPPGSAKNKTESKTPEPKKKEVKKET